MNKKNIFSSKVSKPLDKDTFTEYQNLIETMPVMIYAAEPFPPYSPLYISPAFEMFGYPLEEWRESLDLWVRTIHPDDRQRILFETKTAMGSGGETDFEYRIVASNGDVYWVRDRGCFVRDEEGNLIYWQGIIIDVTDRKKGEECLRDSEKRYRQMFEKNQAVKLLIDADTGAIIEANPSACVFYGYSSEEFKTKNINELNILPQAEIEREMKRTINEDCNYFIFKHRTASGELRDVEVHSSQIFDENRNLLYSIVYDITERRTAERELEKREELYRTLARHIPKTAVLLFNRDLRYTLAEGMQLKSRGFSKEMFEGKTLWEVFPPEICDEWSDYYRRALAGESISLEEKSDQGYFQTYIIPVKNEREEIFTGMLIWQDITEFKQTENALVENEERYRDLFENANDLIYIHDLEGNFISINHAAERVFGYPREEALKMNINQIITPDYLKLAQQKLSAKTSGTKQAVYEVDCLTKEGRRITLEINSRAIFKDGKAVAVQGIARDITERKQIEKAIHRSETELQALLAAITDVILVFDSEGRYLKIASTNHKGLFKPAGELIGKTIRDVFPKPQADYFLDKIREALTGRKPVRMEYSLVIGAEELWFSSVISPMMADSVVVVAHDITNRKQAEETLREQEEQYRELFENANDLIYTHDLQGNFTSLNRAGELITGYTREEALKMNIAEVVAPDYLESARQMIHQKITGEMPTTYDLDIIAKQGNRVSLELSTRLIYHNGIPVGVQGIARNITERKRVKEALINSERRYRLLGEGIMHQVWTAQPDGKLDYINERTLEYFDLTIEQLIGEGWQTVVHPEDLPGCIKKWTSSLETGKDYEVEFRLKRYDGTYRWHQARATAGLDAEGKIISWFGTNTDIDDKKIAEAKLNYFAGHDALTNLPNRAKFMNHLERAAKRAECNSAFRFAVLYLDLDRFKLINDSLGHSIGDKLLIVIAERLESCVRPGDLVARLGGDEFTILLCNINEPSDAARVAERFLDKLSTPFKLDGYEVFTSASIGIIVSDEIPRQPDDFLRDADTAMYRAKEAGKARYEIFDREMHIRNMNLLEMENDLRRAIENDEFRVFYQPIVSLDTGEVREFEALIRWQHPQHGLVMPNEFISVAEETGLIIPIGEWILREACRQTAEWRKLISEPAQLSVSVNLSAKQLMHPNLAAQIGAILSETALNPRCLKLEVTESMVMENSEKALAVISNLKKLGISFSTDDFGTGYSSLSYLHRFPFNYIKIDRSFVSKMDSDRKSEAIVRTILLLGQNLHIEVVAEGIETRRQLEALRQLGCKTGQGYFFAKPVNAESAARILHDGLPHIFETSLFNFNKSGERQIVELDKIQ